MKLISRIVSVSVLSRLLLTGTHVSAKQETVVPFITDELYQDNISREYFNKNTRKSFRSEAAFDLIVDYVKDETGFADLGDTEFIALMADDNYTRVRDCPTSEKIRTGALQGSEFYWIDRQCRANEQIVQVKVAGGETLATDDDVWKDMFSLNCLNAVEDKTPVSKARLARVVIPRKEETSAPVAETVNPQTMPRVMSKHAIVPCHWVEENVTYSQGLTVWAPSIFDPWSHDFYFGGATSVPPSTIKSYQLQGCPQTGVR